MYTGARGDLIELKTHLLSKVLWDPNADERTIMDDFLNNYYGAAGTYIDRYIHMIHYSMLELDERLSIYGSPIDAKETYLTDDLREEYRRLFDQAEEVVKTEPKLLKRVQRTRLPIMYGELEISTSFEGNNPQ